MTSLTLRKLYRELVKTGERDREILLVFADALDEVGAGDLAFAYRWAYEHDTWPFLREEYGNRPIKRGLIYDWDSKAKKNARTSAALGAGKNSRKPGTRGWCKIPEMGRLPHHIYKTVCRLDDKTYGSLNRAFVLLARALKVIQDPASVVS